MTGRPRMNGTDLQATIAGIVHVYGGMVFHPRKATVRPGKTITPVQFDGKGYPDLTIVMDTGVLFVEVKGDGDTLKPDQRLWLARLAGHPRGSEATDDDITPKGRIAGPVGPDRHDRPAVYVWTPRHLRDETIRETIAAMRDWRGYV